MKSIFYLIVLVFVIGLVGCSEEEEPRSPLIGTWESRVYVDSLDYWFVESYAFKNDSIFDIEWTVRNTETGPDLGYRMTAASWYELEEDTFKYYYSDVLMEFESLYVPKEELKPAIVDFFRIPQATLTFSQDRRQFELQVGCFQPSPGTDCVDFPAKVYVRVD